MKLKSNLRDMTQGSIYRHILAYAIPLVFGNMMQLTYNVVDSVIVSKGVGVDALSAVSVSNPVSVLIIQGISGIGIGASVHMSKFFGAGDRKRLKRAFSSTIIFGTVLSIIILILGFILAPEILILMNVPDQIMIDSVRYLRLIFIGSLFTFQYNIVSSALRAVGDSKTPVYFVTLSSVLNSCLDMVFIFGMHLGVAGAAYATVIAEAVSALLCFIYVYRKIPELQIRRYEWVLDRKLLKKILSSGMVTAMQQSCQPIGKLLIQSVINVQGINVIAAFNAVIRIDDYGRIQAQTISHGMMTCTAQNRGAGNIERTKETLKKGLIIGAIYYPMIAAVIILFRHTFVGIFAPAAGGDEMMRIGVPYLTIKALTIIFPCVTNGLQGYFRGMDQMKITLASTVIQIAARTFFVYLLVPRIGLNGEAYACAIGWSFMILFEYGYYFLVFRKKVYKGK